MSQSGMWLEIRRGKTNFPLRPISGDRFLIGAGSHCHLQLGGEHVPMLHSLLVIEGKQATLEAVVSEPPLLVNGEVCRLVELSDEDTVVIGDFEFVFHRLVATEPASQAATIAPSMPDHPSMPDDMAQLSQFSAAHLVALIEEDAARVSEYDRNCELGAAALLDAARQIGDASHPATVPMTTYRQADSEGLRTEPLTTPSQSLAEREAECLRLAAQLQLAQQQLALQMEEFAKQISSWQGSGDLALHRFSA